ncbi:hypothetical protein EG329_005662 [Mollisiaceae sp. DMI_Dod_QoI]|nr:hypothetical protein EG329_005662 [Helotiales sp. DMI_Dod_QoI]
MSGAEAILVLGVISSIISIVDGTKQVYDAATNAEGLPEAFREVADRLPIITNILSSAKQHIDGGELDEKSCQAVKQVVEACEKKAKALDDLFRKVIPANGASRQEIYLSAVRTLGKGSQVETLMKGMLEDVQLLTSEHDMKIGTKTEKDQLAKAIAEALKDLVAGDQHVSPDIHRFIDAKVDELSTHRQYSEPLRIRIKEAFRNRAQGTFLWVGIVAKALRNYKPTEVEDALDYFPSGLNELYSRLLLQIPVDRRDIAAKILRWVVLAVRPLTLSELSTAVDIAGNVSSAFSSTEVMRDQVSHCGYFLTIKKRKKEGKDVKIDEDEVGLIHQSAKDYLLRETPNSNAQLEFFRVKEDIGNLEITSKCLKYLQDGALANGKVDLRRDTAHLKAFPFLEYAVMHWPEHARSLDRSEDIFDLSLPFYHEKSSSRMAWLETYRHRNHIHCNPESFSLLHLVSHFGILPIAEKILLEKSWKARLKLKFKLNGQDGFGSTPLLLATVAGHEAMVQLLLRNGANIEARNGNGMTALFWAAGFEYESMLRLLLANGGNIEVRDEEGQTALIRATQCRQEAVVRLLLEKGANIEARDKRGQTALMYAAMSGEEAAVRFLLSKGANIKAARDEEGDTAFTRAAWYGHEAVVRLLLEKGADIENRDKILGETALVCVARQGHDAVMQLLLEKGANMEATGKDEQTALIWAAQKGHEAVVRLLLEKSVNVEARDKKGRTALTWAAEKEHEAAVRLLLEKGANIEVRDNKGRTALISAASGWGSQVNAVVQLLLEKGANIEARDNERRRTALVWATSNGHEGVVRLLLEKGADIEASDNSGQTALICAAYWGREAIVRSLLEKGAEISAKDFNGKTAREVAARARHEAVVKLLSPSDVDSS